MPNNPKGVNQYTGKAKAKKETSIFARAKGELEALKQRIGSSTRTMVKGDGSATVTRTGLNGKTTVDRKASAKATAAAKRTLTPIREDRVKREAANVVQQASEVKAQAANTRYIGQAAKSASSRVSTIDKALAKVGLESKEVRRAKALERGFEASKRKLQGEMADLNEAQGRLFQASNALKAVKGR